MSREQDDKCFQFVSNLELFGLVVTTPQLIAMYTNANAYKFYTDTDIGNIPNIVSTTVGPALVFLIAMCCILKTLANRAEEERVRVLSEQLARERPTQRNVATNNSSTPDDSSVPKSTYNSTNLQGTGKSKNTHDGHTQKSDDNGLGNALEIVTFIVAVTPPHSRSTSPVHYHGPNHWNDNNDNNNSSDSDYNSGGPE